MLTAKDGDYDQTDAFDLGADDYLTKPFSFMILVARLRALVRRGAPERPVLISVGSLIAGPGVAVWTRPASRIPLTAREYGLLLFLMRNAGDVVSKAADPGQRLGLRLQGGDNVVEVYISYLRKKIDVPFGLRPSGRSAAWAIGSTPTRRGLRGPVPAESSIPQVGHSGHVHPG